MNGRSTELFETACKVMPGGVNSPVRACRAVGRTPRFIARAKGDRIFDVDGNEFIDYVCSWGPGILGHAHPAVVEAVQKACADGLTFGAPTAREVELAERIRALMPSMEMSRMVNSGTEAVMSAVRLARGFTGRDDIVKFEGCYHGHSDGLLVKAGSGLLTDATPDSAGVPKDFARHTHVIAYNDSASLEELFKKTGDTLAAVVVEPVAANMGVVLPKDGFLQALRDITSKHGALLIFDEVITGFRLGLGGAQEYFGVKPDLTTLGKIVGGGMPAAVYGGRADVMSFVAPEGPVYQAGTLAGNPLATAAGLATLDLLAADPAIYERLERKTRKLAETVRRAGGDDVRVPQIGSLMSVFFGNEPRAYGTTPDEKFTAWYGHLLDAGVYVAPSRFESMFVSDAHSDDDIAQTIQICERFFDGSAAKHGRACAARTPNTEICGMCGVRGAPALPKIADPFV